MAMTTTYMAYFCALPVAVVAAAGILGHRERWRQTVLHLAFAASGIVVALAPIAAAYYRVRSEYALVRRADEIEIGSADVTSFIAGKPRIGIWRWRFPAR